MDIEPLELRGGILDLETVATWVRKTIPAPPAGGFTLVVDPDLSEDPPWEALRLVQESARSPVFDQVPMIRILAMQIPKRTPEDPRPSSAVFCMYKTLLDSGKIGKVILASHKSRAAKTQAHILIYKKGIQLEFIQDRDLIKTIGELEAAMA